MNPVNVNKLSKFLIYGGMFSFGTSVLVAGFDYFINGKNEVQLYCLSTGFFAGSSLIFSGLILNNYFSMEHEINKTQDKKSSLESKINNMKNNKS
ncbi:MAG: hypothetical protein QXI33_03785 [Candidatus Pacearchaeota archaeon]